MKAAVFLKPNKIEIKEVAKPKIKADEILMKTKSVGICGTDLHIYSGGYKVPQGSILGHEFSGIISEVGEKVKDFKVGDRIVAEHVIPCGKCEMCKKGKPNLCDKVEVIGVGKPGALAEYVAIPANLCYKFPATVSFEEAALIEPLSISVYALKQAGQLLDRDVAIVGQGPIGILLDQLLKLAGAKVVGFDVLLHRLKFVKDKGWVDKIVNSSQDISSWYNKFDRTFEVVGKEITAQMSINIARRDGDIFLVGVFGEPTKIDLMKVVKKELNIFGSWTCAFTFPESIDLLASGKIDLKSLITHRYHIDEVSKAFDEASQYSEDRIKTIINVS